MSNFPEACLTIDADDRIVGINLAGEKLLKIKQADVCGKPLDELFPKQVHSVPCFESSPGKNRKITLSRSDGEAFYAELKVSSILGEDQASLGRILVVRRLNQVDRDSAVRNQNAILTALQETTFDLHSSLELDIVLKNIVERACMLLGTSHGYLDILRDDRDELEPVVGIGVLEESLKHEVVKGVGVAGTVWETGKPLVVCDYDQWSNRMKAFRRGIIRGIVGMPLIIKGQVVGVIGVARGVESDEEISMDDVSVLSRFADLAAVALQNARLFEKAQKEIEYRRKTEIELRDANQRLQLQFEREEMLQGQLKELAIRDPLTDLFNRRYLQETLPVEFARAKRSETSLATLMMDSDHLKEINDRYGHKAGDDFIVLIANVIRENIRAGDIACRYGGDEFAIVLNNVSKTIAQKRAELLRDRIATHPIMYEGDKVGITVSIGIAMYPVHGTSVEGLLQKADQALYLAKQKGKNCVVFYREDQG